MRKPVLVLVVLVFVFAQEILADNSIETAGSISAVTVFRGQALVTRTIEINLPADGVELVVGKLPSQIVPESLYVQSSNEISVSGVRYREKSLKEYAGQEANQIDTEIEKLNRELKHIQTDIEYGDNKWKRYDSLWSLTKKASQADPNKALEIGSVERLTDFIEDKLDTLRKNSVPMEDIRDDLQKKIKLLQQKKDELQTSKETSRREAVLFVSGSAGKKAVIRLNYLVRGPHWIPQYNLRAVPAEENVLVEYNALIFQNSDEDWQRVAVSLSTAEPTTAAYPPMIEPIKVKVGAALPPAAKEDKSKDLKSEPMHSEPPQTNWSDKYRQGQVNQRAAAQRGKEAQRELNVAAVSNQMLELEADRTGVQVMKEEAQRFARTEGVSVMYSLPGKFTIPGKTGQQQATVTAFTAKGDFIMIATPLLTNYVYLQADIVNSSDSVLLAGPVNMYCDGSFVGKGELGLITAGGKFTAGFGVDSQIRITRELQDKKIETAWKNHVETYHYRLAIENYKNSKVKLRLMDRIPYTEDTNLEIKDFQTDTPLSTDAEYLRTERNKGILRWDLELKPGTTGQNAKIIIYNYTMKCGSELKVQPAAD